MKSNIPPPPPRPRLNQLTNVTLQLNGMALLRLDSLAKLIGGPRQEALLSGLDLLEQVLKAAHKGGTLAVRYADGRVEELVPGGQTGEAQKSTAEKITAASAAQVIAKAAPDGQKEGA